MKKNTLYVFILATYLSGYISKNKYKINLHCYLIPVVLVNFDQYLSGATPGLLHALVPAFFPFASVCFLATPVLIHFTPVTDLNFTRS